ncbi:MAG: inositol monophosphatase [Candidatus Wildermuthbacteria bacterium]|nr:inositol monophosphatase [Candidatus Wildermuthbacteria bacterium]
MNYPDAVFPLLEEAGEELKKQYGNVKVVHEKVNSYVDFVTDLDRETENLLRERLRKVFTSVEFFGEEFGGNKEAERFWLCDPIDGTAHFVRGLPFCTTMLALVEDGNVVFSVIYDFVKGDFYWAQKGKGAWKNKEQIHVSNRSLKEGYVSFEVNIEKSEGNLQKYVWMDNHAGVFHTMSAGFEFAMVASGKLDARISLDPYGKIWDFAPGSLLVAEAGGVVANIGSKTYDYRNFDHIATNPVIYRELTEGENALFPILT